MKGHAHKETGSARLIVMAGLPGTGKSTIANALAERLHAVVLNKDAVRSRLFAPDRIDFSRAQDDLCMNVIYLIAEHLMGQRPDQIIIVDGRTFSKRYQVDDLLSHAHTMDHTPFIIECVCDDIVARERLERDRMSGAHPAGNRDFALYLELKKKAEPIMVEHLVIDTGRLPLALSVDRSLTYLDRAR